MIVLLQTALGCKHKSIAVSVKEAQKSQEAKLKKQPSNSNNPKRSFTTPTQPIAISNKETAFMPDSTSPISRAPMHPLHVVAGQGDIKKLEVKVLQAATVIQENKKDDDAQTSLYLADTLGHTEEVKSLLSVDEIEVNKKKKYGFSPLHIAVLKGHTEEVKMLLSVDGIEVNKKKKYGFSPLHIAVLKGHTEEVKMLLSVDGIEVNKKKKYGFSPLCLAKLGKHDACIKLLEDAIRDRCN